MALQKQTIPISFTSGINTKSDSKLVMPADLLELENAVFTKYGALNKRYGYEVLGTQIEGGSQIDQGEALGVFNEELNLYTGKKLYSYAPSTNSWVDKGDMVSVIVSDTPIVKNSYTQSHVSCDFNENVTVYAWEDSRGGVRYSVIDQLTNTVFSFDQVLDALAARPKVVAFEQYLLIFYRLTADTSLRYKAISINTPTTIGPSVTVTTDMNASYNYDVANNQTNLVVVYHDDTNTVTIRTIDATFTISGPTILSEDATGCLTVVVDDAQNSWIALHNGTDVVVSVYNFILTQVLAQTTVETIASVTAITGCVTDDEMTVWYSVAASPTQNHLTRFNTVDLTGTVGAPSDFLRSVYLASKAFRYNGICYVNVLHESTLQSTFFCVTENQAVVAKMSYGTGGTRITNTLLTTVPAITDSTYLFTHQEKTQFISENNTIFSTLGIYSSDLDFSSENKFQNAQLGQLHMVGGILQSYDGVTVTEHNFHLYPENVSSATATTGGLMLAGTYSYKVCYEWTDNLGQIHRSAPSAALQQIVPAGTATNTVTLTIPTLRITQKKDERAPVRLVVYRTQSLGTLYYRVSSITAPLYNDVTVDTLSFVDTLADASIVSNDLLYTTGGVIENIAPPACSLIATFKNRVFLSGLPDPLAYWYSKKRIEGTPVEFSDFFTGRVDSFGGDITAIYPMDSNVIIFKRQAVFALAGDGPNDTGQQNDYGDPQLITSDAGCDNPNSIVMTPDGLMFKSTKGIYRINRALNVEYIGDKVEDFNSKTIAGSALVPDTNQVRFVTEEDPTLMYDYYFQQWGTFTNQSAEDCQIWDNTFLFLKANGEVWKENTSFQDNDLPIVMKITTSWMSMAGVQGFQRAYRMIFLGEFKSYHKMQIAIGYDFNPNFSQFGIIDISDVYVISAYGDDSPYGTDGSSYGYGGAYPLYQFKTHLTRQKCQSIRFRFMDDQNHLENYGEGFNLCNIALEVGIKPTLRKFEATNSFPTQG